MYISKLFNKIRNNGQVTLILKNTGESLVYFMISSSVGYSVITTGLCDGEMSEDFMSFSIMLNTISPLIEKDHKYKLVYKNGKLQFCSRNNHIKLTPLFVESIDDKAKDVLARYFELEDSLKLNAKIENIDSEINDLYGNIAADTDELNKLEEHFGTLESLNTVQEMDLFNSLNESNKEKVKKALTILHDRIKQNKYRLEHLNKGKEEMKLKLSTAMKELDMSSFETIIKIAAKQSEYVSFCNTFATVALKESFLFEKNNCILKGVSGILLNNLLQRGTGKFFEFQDYLIYNSNEGDTKTCVFIDSYLPNTKVDTSLIKRGKLLEQCTINIGELKPLIPIILSKFNSVFFDMDTSIMTFKNDMEEVLELKIIITNLETLALRKMQRGDSNVDLSLSKFIIPKSVIALLPYLDDELTLYVKDRKVIFNINNFYIVFSKTKSNEVT